jgi:UDP-N-acetylmuramate--alanine ligase
MIGLSGSGMRALADLMVDSQWRLSGSDRQPIADPRLEQRAAEIHEGHSADHLPDDAEMVVYSLAIDEDNPELVKARTLDIPCHSYPQMLGKLMACGFGLAVAGTHGKSTTCAMAAEVLMHAGLDPTTVYGAEPLEGVAGRLGGGKFMLAEACEYRRSFLNLRPKIAVLLNVETDHFDCYGSLVEVQQAYSEFVRRVTASGLLLAHSGCRATQAVVRDAGCRVAQFGIEKNAEWRAADLKMQKGRYRFRVLHRERPVTEITLRLPGKHNVLNALAATAMASELGVRAHHIAEALNNFRGLKRRLEVLGTFGGVTLIDDYAHHPTEVTAALQTVRQMFPERRVWCVFQPHQVSRTRALLQEFAAALAAADWVAVSDIYAARESSAGKPAVTAADLAQAIRAAGGEVVAEHAFGDIIERLGSQLQPGDVLITMGAGDIRKVADGVVDRFRIDRAAG